MDLKNLNTKKNNISIQNRYILRERLGGGAFGQLYSTVCKGTQFLLATKLETRINNKSPLLPREAQVLMDVENEVGFPILYAHGHEETFYYVVMSLLGPNLEKLFRLCDKQLSLKTGLMLADQMLTRIEALHNKGYLHRDIKPENYCMGAGEDGHNLFIIDFGLARSYKEPNGQHIPYKDKKGLIGTARYASLNTHLGIEQSRRDDLESIGYTLIYLMKGELPWQIVNLQQQDKQDKYKQIAEMKSKITMEELCSGLPQEFVIYMNYVRGLGFTDAPDYRRLKKLFRTLFIKMNFNMDFDYDWLDIQFEQPRRGKTKKHMQANVNMRDSAQLNQNDDSNIKVGKQENHRVAETTRHVQANTYKHINDEQKFSSSFIRNNNNLEKHRNESSFAKVPPARKMDKNKTLMRTKTDHDTKDPYSKQKAMKFQKTFANEDSKFVETSDMFNTTRIHDIIDVPGELSSNDSYGDVQIQQAKHFVTKTKDMTQRTSKLPTSSSYHEGPSMKNIRQHWNNKQKEESITSTQNSSDKKIVSKKSKVRSRSALNNEKDIACLSNLESEDENILTKIMQQKKFVINKKIFPRRTSPRKLH